MQARVCFFRFAVAAVVGIAAVSVSAEEEIRSALPEGELLTLFDGQSLDGWKKVGGLATYSVEDSEIVGKVGPGPNTFLRTEREYGDFVLELEYKLDVPGNSGIQFRSHQRPGENGRVFGYQNEIDPSDRAWSSGIYDEARRGWLFPLKDKPKAQAAFRKEDWNHVTIQALGPSIKTWLNGVPAADLIDTADLSGFVALQVHSGKAGQIRWRNIRLMDFGQSQWKSLLNPELEGWTAQGGGQWQFVDGVLKGTAPASNRQHGLLMTKKTYSDFAVRVVYQAEQGNSGLYFRSEPVDSAVGVHGFQAEIDPNHDAGGLYETGGRAWVVKPKPQDVKKWHRPGEWNEMTVVAVGERVVVHVNGYKTAELRDPQGRKQGVIALQLHGGQDMDVAFKSVEVLDLTAPLYQQAFQQSQPVIDVPEAK